MFKLFNNYDANRTSFKKIVPAILLSISVLMTVQIGLLNVFIPTENSLKNIFLSMANAQTEEFSTDSGTIHITNRLTEDTKKDRTVLEYEKGKPIGGAKFVLYRIEGLNTKKDEDWAKYSNLKPENVSRDDNGYPTKAGAYNLKFEQEITTDDKGFAKTKNTPIGFFYVEQKNIINIENNNLAISEPFFMSLPQPTSDKGFTFGAKVYPINYFLGINSSVKDKDKHAGDSITYTIESDVPMLNRGQKTYSRHIIVNKQPTYIKWDRKPPLVELINKETGAVVERLENSVDYTFTSSKERPRLLNLELTREGIDKMQSYRMGQKGKRSYPKLAVKLTYNADINDMSKYTRDYNLYQINTSYLFTDMNLFESDKIPNGNLDFPNDFSDINSQAESRYGRIIAKATDKYDRPIENTEFQLYKCEPGDTEKATLLENAKPLSISGKKKWKTDGEGNVEISGIKIENWKNGKQIYSNLFDYCLLAVKDTEGENEYNYPIRVELNSDTMILEKTITDDKTHLSMKYLYLSSVLCLIIGIVFYIVLKNKIK